MSLTLSSSVPTWPTKIVGARFKVVGGIGVLRVDAGGRAPSKTTGDSSDWAVSLRGEGRDDVNIGEDVYADEPEVAERTGDDMFTPAGGTARSAGVNRCDPGYAINDPVNEEVSLRKSSDNSDSSDLAASNEGRLGVDTGRGSGDLGVRAADRGVVGTSLIGPIGRRPSIELLAPGELSLELEIVENCATDIVRRRGTAFFSARL